ncbi:MAG: hypothetical protein IJC16_00050 [Rikenellaceae bacterium]|nr:hypothetical protein [Rikenellaceae bacterium]
MILPNDILIRETPNGTTVWVSQRLVVEVCEVNDEYLRTHCRDRYKQSLPASWQKAAGQGDFFLGDSGKSWRWGRRGGQYYYDIDRIPNRKPACYRDLLPSKEELIAHVDGNNLRNSRERQAGIARSIRNAVSELRNEEDARWIHTRSGYQVKASVASDYAQALAWCRFIRITVGRNELARYGLSSVGQLYESCAGILEELNLSNFRITTPESLRKKLAGFPEDPERQRMWIISGKHGNDNRKIVGVNRIVDVRTGEIHEFDIHQAIMYQAYMNIDDPRKEYQKTLYDTVYVPTMEAFGECPVSLRSFNSHLTRFCYRLQTSMHRNGRAWYRKHMLTYIPAARLVYAHSLFCGDGSGLIGYKYWKKSYKGGKPSHELKVKNLYAILITDVASGYIAGFEFSPEGYSVETGAMMREAVRMAVEQGGRQTMFEFVSDKHGAFTDAENKEFLRSVFNVVRTIASGNSQANPAEIMFKLFKNGTLRRFRNFVRSSHEATDPENFANTDHITKEEYPTYNEAIEQIRSAIDRWNDTPRGDGRTPRQIFFESKHPDCEPMAAMQVRDIMGNHTKVEVTRMRGFVEVTHAGHKSLFEIPDYHNTGARRISAATGYGYDAHVYVHWDESGADLYSSDGKYILTCPPADRAGKAYAELTDEQRAARRRLAERQASQIEASIAFGQSALDAVDALYSGNGYAADMALGGDKESYNAAREDEIDAMIPDKTGTSEPAGQQEDESKARIDPKQAAFNRFLGII